MHKFFGFLFSFSLLFSLAEAHEEIEDKSNLTIQTPTLSDRKMKKLRLDNGLEALLISDPGTTQSGAALAVAVGSWDDPKDRPGMAHFVEHLLFLGTEKYPEESGYTRYLDEKDGNRNAFTMADRTVYMFSINNDGFDEALDRFGQFFISPLFNPSGVDRECKAIHQEFCKYVPVDGWRKLYVKKELANEEHPFHSFCIGNSDTLANITQDELKEWYRNHYSANLMHLIVYASSDLDSLEKEVVSIFEKVENKQKEPSRSPHSLFKQEQMAKMIAIAPVQNIQILELSWELPREFGKDQEMHTDKLISHILGHEGESSLLAHLKKENLATALGIGNFNAGKDQALFSITVELTSKGVKEYEKVIERTFEALSCLKESGVPKYVFEEVQRMEEMQYKFQGRQDVFQLVMDYATQLIDEPLETFPRKTLIPTVYSPEHIQDLLGHLTPQNCQFTLVANPEISKVAITAKEKWMGVEYSVLPVSKEKIALWSQAKSNPKISIPRPNPYIPENFATSSPTIPLTMIPKPILLSDSPNGKTYFCRDAQFSEPEISYIFRIKTPQILDHDAKSQAKADLLCYAVNEKLNATAYEASLAGLSYSLHPSHYWLELKITGYSDKAAPFLTSVMEGLKNIELTKTEFETYKEKLQREYANKASESPLKEGRELLLKILYKDHSSLSEKSKAIESISHKEMMGFCNAVFQKTYVEGMLYGNLDEKTARSICHIVDKTLGSLPFPLNKHPKIELAHLPEKEPSLLFIKTKLTANALILTTDCGDFSFKKRAAQEILTKGLEEPFFSELRTKQQTAYLVSNWSQEIERHLYSFFAIQSSSHDARDLLARFELFLESSLQNLKDDVITESRFETIRDSIVKKLEYPAENLQKMGSLLHSLAFDYDGGFSWMDQRISSLKELTYAEFLDYAKEFLGKQNPRRLALCVSGDKAHKDKFGYKEHASAQKVREEIQYKGRIKEISLQ